MHVDSTMGKRALAKGLNPETSSIFDVHCAEAGMPKPTSGSYANNYSWQDLAAAKLGKPISQVSLEEINKVLDLQ